MDAERDAMPGPETAGSDRRSLLKKAAVAAGVVAWTTPVVQAVTARPAFAQTVTNCNPIISVLLVRTSSGSSTSCGCAPGASGEDCCLNTWFAADWVVNCGDTCGGRGSNVSLQPVTGAVPGCLTQNRQITTANCLDRTPIQVAGEVLCSGQLQTFSGPAAIINCFLCVGFAEADEPDLAIVPEPAEIPEARETDTSVDQAGDNPATTTATTAAPADTASSDDDTPASTP